MKKFIIITFMVACLLPAFSQFGEDIYLDAGGSAVSEGAFGRIASLTSYRMANYQLQLGLQGTISGADRSLLSGAFLDLRGDYLIREFPFSVSLFFRRNPYSSLINETNFGLVAEHRRNHVEVRIGYNSRIYSMKEGEMDLTDLENPDLHIYEWRNFMYKGILWLMPMVHDWNLGGALTNYDYFLIQQETNPMLTVLFRYNVSGEWQVFSEAWYQGAGMLNLASNYYGYYLRAGFRWQIN